MQDLTKRFGGLVAVNAVSFDVEDGEIVSIIGPNGAGKSTLFKLITSFLRPTAGRVSFNGEAITGGSPISSPAAGSCARSRKRRSSRR